MRISVCIPTYNGEKFIRDQLDSILVQLTKDDEVIISDDSSTDNTIKIIESYRDSRIKVFKSNRFYSPIFNLENALKNSSGDYIFLSDQDDIWLKNKVSIMIKELQSYDLVISDAIIINKKGLIKEDSFFKQSKKRHGLFNNLIKNNYLGCTMAFKSNFKSIILPFPKNIPMHDIWIGNIISLKGKTKFIDDKLIKYRRHGNNASPTTEKSSLQLTYRIFYRIRLVYELFNRLIGFKKS